MTIIFVFIKVSNNISSDTVNEKNRESSEEEIVIEVDINFIDIFRENSHLRDIDIIESIH